MVKNKEILQVNLRRMENESGRAYGLYFTVVKYKGCLSTRALAEYIASHGSIWACDIVEGVQKQLQVCIPEKVCQGYDVQPDDLSLKAIDHLFKKNPLLRQLEGGGVPGQD